AAILFVIYYVADEPRMVGQANPELAWRALVALFGFGCLELVLLQRRFPSAQLQTYLQFAADLAAITLLLHASGGVASGLGGLLIVSVGGLALLVQADRAFLLAAISTLTLLGQQVYAYLQGASSSSEFAPVGILGAVIFVITAVVQLLRRQIVETEALAEQRGVDLKNLVELNEYIIQHLRESIVVVDGDDRIRLINASAAKHLGAAERSPGVPLGQVSEALAERLEAWRADTASPDKARRVFPSSDGASNVQPHFAPLGPDRRGGVLIFLEDTSL